MMDLFSPTHLLVLLVLVRTGFHLDKEQLHLRGMTGSGLRLGLVLALFSFVGFESATTLGSEARNPLKTIPRSIIWSPAGGCTIRSGSRMAFISMPASGRVWLRPEQR